MMYGHLEGTHEVYSVSEQDFMNNVIEHHKKYSSPKEETPIYSNAETLRNLAETLVDNLTTLNGSTSTGLLSSYYLSSFNPVVWDCLNGASVNTDFPKDFFEANNFNLIITDPVASTIISGSKALSKNPIYGVLVNAKVQTSFNSGAFGELDWVPEKGMTNSVDFLIFFTNSSWKGAGKCAYITNVTIVNYESIEN